ncbi:hypothetical protein [Bryobacter aggregatus]|uniref:hypothetical protein n=1 Tax=Bryobacter aggregatus TaxID=360054 RepID=UPI0004E1456F|nr:hypothetical protein [Bryobacter aggregatus]
MAAIGRRNALALIGASLTLHAEVRDELREVLAGMATSLSAANFSAFFKSIDKAMPGYPELRQQITGLCEMADISSSIEIQTATGDATHQTALIDWYMNLKPLSERIVNEQRRESLTFQFEKRGKKWIITKIDPISFFELPKL